MSERWAVTPVNLLPWGVLLAAGLSPESTLPLALGQFVLGYVSCPVPWEETVSEVVVK